MPSQTKFVLLSGPRTGSTYLVDYLDATPGTRCCSELFQEDRIDFRHMRPADPRLAEVAFRDADPMRFLDLVAAEAGNCTRVGFKLIGSQIARLDPAFVRAIATSRDWKKIFLWRDDVVEQSVSFLLARQHFREKIWERIPERERITIPPMDMQACLHMIETSYFLVESMIAMAARDDVFELEYDELGSRPAMRGLLRFLGLDDAAADERLAHGDREADRFERGPRLAERLANYEEIQAFFARGRYGRFVKPAPVPPA